MTASAPPQTTLDRRNGGLREHELRVPQDVVHVEPGRLELLEAASRMHAENDQAVLLVFFMQFDQVRDAGPTRTTPRRPVVDQDNLAVEAIEIKVGLSAGSGSLQQDAEHGDRDKQCDTEAVSGNLFTYVNSRACHHGTVNSPFGFCSRIPALET